MEQVLKDARLLRRDDTLTRLVVLLWLFMAVLLIGYGEHAQHLFERHQRELSEKATQGVADLGRFFLNEERREAQVFAHEYRGLLEALAADPTDTERYASLVDRVTARFQYAFSVAIASTDGEVIVDGFDGRIEEACRGDIHAFAQGEGPTDVVIHPNPLGYHFDIMTNWDTDRGVGGILFISMSPDVFARILSRSELPGHELYLVNRLVPGLIEVGSEGSRNRLQRPFRLSEDEIGRIASQRSLPGTAWDIVDIPSAGIAARQAFRVRMQVLAVFVCFLSVTLYMTYLIRREEQGRQRAEEALGDTSRLLQGDHWQHREDLKRLDQSVRQERLRRDSMARELKDIRWRLSLAMKGAGGVMWHIDPESGKFSFFPARQDAAGDPNDNSPGTLRAWLEHVHPDDRPQARSAVEAAVNGDSPQVHAELRLRRRSGGYRSFVMSGSVERDSTGSVVSAAGFLSPLPETDG
ncbi:MAG: PAS domain-containing protein [Gammaproteobacteria bacterium]|jgi:PAS domain-containing protein|nr:PAS domain-containing protein [Gammaproteobacteria bacterium]